MRGGSGREEHFDKILSSSFLTRGARRAVSPVLLESGADVLRLITTSAANADPEDTTPDFSLFRTLMLVRAERHSACAPSRSPLPPRLAATQRRGDGGGGGELLRRPLCGGAVRRGQQARQGRWRAAHGRAGGAPEGVGRAQHRGVVGCVARTEGAKEQSARGKRTRGL